MGNSSSSGRGHHEETVDLGFLTPQGIYTGPRDWNQAIVSQLIVDRKLAPFYRPLEDYEESWDDEQIIAAMKEPPQVEGGEAETSTTRAESASVHSSNSRTHHKRPSATAKEPARNPEAGLYYGAVECPICFLVRFRTFRRVISLIIRQPSTIPLISITLVVATKPSAQNVLCRSREQTLLLPISSPNLPPVHIVYRRTSASSIPLRLGVLVLIAMDGSALLLFPHKSL